MSISREVLAKYVKPGYIFVEAGSRWGDTLLRAVELGAADASGCESDQIMAGLGDAHVKELRKNKSASISHMDSVKFLGFFPLMKCAGCTPPIVVFLDAHTETHSPVLGELATLSRWEHKPHAILIDDMRCMEGWGITKEMLFAHLKGIADYKISFEDGVVPEDIMVAQL